MSGGPSLKGLLVALTLALLVAPGEARDWSEPGGGPLNRSAVADVEAPRTAPVERWRVSFDVLLSEPVVESDFVYVTGRRKKTRRLYAIAADTGEEVAAAKLKVEAPYRVSALGSTIVVVGKGAMEVFERRKNRLKRTRTIQGRFESAATLLPGLAIVTGGGAVRVLDLRSGDEVFRHESVALKPVAIEREPGVADLYFTKRREGKQSPQTLYQFRLTGVGTRKPAAVDIDQSILSPALTGESQTPRLVHIDRGHVDRFLVAMEMPVKLMGGGELPFFFWPTESSAALPAMVASPVVWGNVVYGRSRDGMLVQQEIGDVGRGLLEAAERPAGAVDGPITCANGVLLLGNYALDIETRRILWTAPDLKFDGRLVPAVDGVVVFHDGEGSLVAAEGSGPSAGAGADATSLAAAIEPTLPGTGDAVVLVDGTRIPGRLETGEDGAARVVAADGAAPIPVVGKVCAVETESGVEVVGDPYGLAIAARLAIELELARALCPLIERGARSGLVAEARALLDEARERGLPDAEARELELRLSGKKESVAGNRDRQLAAVRRGVEKARVEALDRAVTVVTWLADAGLALEASDVLSRSIFIWPGDGLPPAAFERLEPIAKDLIPSRFPWRGERDAWKRWLIWAPEIAPAGARFLAKDEMPDLGPASSMWRRGTIALRTDNVVLLSRTDDPALVGPCLRHAEAAIRTLDEVLVNPPEGDEAPLEIRIHRSRADYLAEDLGEGNRANEWSLGFYSPALRASRFHAPEEDLSLHAGRALHEVVAHEVTHQYIAERWRALGKRAMRSPATRGFWLVEGFARFIEDQALEMGRRGNRLDDATVQSVEAASVLAKQDQLLPFESFFEAQQAAFLKLPEEEVARVRLRTTLVTLAYSAKSLYYEQAGALVFFLYNRRGPEGPERFREVLRDHYRSTTRAGAWEKLGFETVEALEKAFLGFLADPSAR
ncbi:MAG: hypothetical protein AAF957_13225 [Planctomycetota bacterium]